MKGKILLVIPVALLALSIIPAKAAPTWYNKAEMEITGFTFMGPDPGGRGLLFDVTFVGVAAGPNIKEATVEGVDHLLMDWEGIGHLDVYLTDTDKQGEKISAHITGLAVTKTPGRIVFENAQATVINTAGYPTTGKYTDLIGTTFNVEGFITELSINPPSGYIHAKWCWT
ncbi:MAG: hypothetical protein QXG76_02365 [Candidatus Bathyarchaeia archaeon]